MTASHKPEDGRFLSRLTAVAETLVLLTACSLLAREFAEAVGLPTRAARDSLLFAEEGPDWRTAARMEALWLGLRYSLTLALAWLVCLWVGGPSRRLAGLSLGGRSLPNLIGFGLLMGLLLNIPTLAGHVAQHAFGLGVNTPLWDLMRRSEWTGDFWLFMAASSFVIVAAVEELYFRSYTLGRYRMHFTPGGAILLCAAFFWMAHGQYLQRDPFLLYNSALVFVGSSIIAWSVVRTGSVIPAIVAHALINAPVTLAAMPVAITASLIALIAFRRSIGANALSYLQVLATTREWLTLAFLIALLVGAATVIRAYPAAIMPMLAVFLALTIYGLFRRAPGRRKRRAA